MHTDYNTDTYKPERARAYMEYDIIMSCGGKLKMRAAAGGCGELAFAPGTVSAGNFCGTAPVEICIPSCGCVKPEPVCVPVEYPHRTICKTSCEEDCQNKYPCECIWTETACCSVQYAHIGDTITYAVTFTNHSPYMLNGVRLFSDVPVGVTVIINSINPAPLPGETLQTGITIGDVPAGGIARLEFRAVVNQDSESCLASRAHAEYYYTDCAGCRRRGVGGECVGIVKIEPCKSLCEQVCRSFNIDGFASLCDCFIYYNGVRCYNAGLSYIAAVGYGITLKYIDETGKKRTCDFEETVLFILPECASGNLSVKFTDLNCRCGCREQILITFNAVLSYYGCG